MHKMAAQTPTGRRGMRLRLASSLMEKLTGQIATGGLGMQLGAGSDTAQKTTSPPQSDPREGLIAWWSFDGAEDSQPDVHDQALPADHLLLSQHVPGVFGRALRLHLTPLVMTKLSRFTDRAWPQITVSAWVLPIGIIDRQDVHYRKDYHYLFMFQPGGRILTFSLNLDGKNQTLDVPIDPADFSDGRWRLITATYDGTAMRLYQDGTEIACRAVTGVVSQTPDNTALIGSQKGIHDDAVKCCPQSRLYDGYLDDVRVYNRSLSAPEIQALFAAGAANLAQSSAQTQRPAQETETQRSQAALREIMQPLDLVERSQRAMHGFMSQVPVPIPGPEGYYRAIFYGQLLPHTRRDSAQWDFGDCTARAVRAWYYLREISGDTTTGAEVEQGERRLLLSIISPKTGLVYVPDRSNIQTGEYYHHCWDQNRTLLAFIWLYQNQPEQRQTLKPVIERMIEGFDRCATIRGVDECWGPYAGWPSDEYINDTPGKPYDDYFANNRVGPFIEPLVFWAQITGDEKYIDMAVRYANCELSGHQSVRPGSDRQKGVFPLPSRWLLRRTLHRQSHHRHRYRSRSLATSPTTVDSQRPDAICEPYARPMTGSSPPPIFIVAVIPGGCPNRGRPDRTFTKPVAPRKSCNLPRPWPAVPLSTRTSMTGPISTMILNPSSSIPSPASNSTSLLSLNTTRLTPGLLRRLRIRSRRTTRNRPSL